MVEEEAYRPVLSMQRAAEDAVAFSDLGSVRDLVVRAVRRIDSTVVHFTGRGSPGALLFENDKGERDEVSISKLLEEMRASTVEGRPALPQVFYLTSCYGASGAEASASAPRGHRQLSELGAVKGEGPSTATTLQREGCPAVTAYFGPVGDQLSTRAEVAFYSGLVAGKRLTESVSRPVRANDLSPWHFRWIRRLLRSPISVGTVLRPLEHKAAMIPREERELRLYRMKRGWRPGGANSRLHIKLP